MYESASHLLLAVYFVTGFLLMEFDHTLSANTGFHFRIFRNTSAKFIRKG